jgi:hypothetical protein
MMGEYGASQRRKTMSDEPNDFEFPDESSLGLVERMNEHIGSRRDFLSNTAKVGAGAAALGVVGTGTAAAAHADEPYSDSPYEDKNQFGYGALTDVQLLHFALLLERLEATFYTEAVGDEPIAEMGTAGSADGARLGEHDVERSAIAQQFANPSIRYSTFQRLKQVREHEQAHVEALEGILAGLQEEGVEAANPNFASNVQFQFPYETVGEFYDLARAIEDTGVGAYNAAAPVIDEEEYLASAAQILAVEGRHASYIRTLNNPLPAGTDALNPFPRAFQQLLSVSTVVNRIEPFVVGADAEDIVALLGMSDSDMPDMAAVTFNDQTTDGSTVTVASANVPDGGFIAIHNSSLLDGNVTGSVIGVSQKLDAGTYMNVEVSLYTGVPGANFNQSALQEDQTLIAMPHKDTNGNGTYDFITSGGKKDGPYIQDGSAVIDKASIRVT